MPYVHAEFIRKLIESEDVTEVMINAWDKIFVEHNGYLVQASQKFSNEQDYLKFVKAILELDKKDKTNRFSIDGRLPDGNRFNVTLPPVAVDTPTVTLRRHARKTRTLADLVQTGFLSDKAALFLKAAVEARLSIVVSGGTGTGKTSFLNSLALCIPTEQRVVSIEDTLELKTPHPNWVQLQTVDDLNVKYTARDCLKNSLRMRPDRIIVGECRGPEAFDMLQAMNTGHEGSMTTIHASSAGECFFRLENLITLGHTDMPLKFVRHQMSNAIQIIVQLKRTSNGKRQVVEILELTGMNEDVITRAPIFGLNAEGHLDVKNYVPDCLKKINQAKLVLPHSLFDQTRSIASLKKSG